VKERGYEDVCAVTIVLQIHGRGSNCQVVYMSSSARTFRVSTCRIEKNVVHH
jgi:hypothetical protein